jgi:hypothetical protein
VSRVVDLERLRECARRAGVQDADIASRTELERALDGVDDRIVDPPGHPLPNARVFIKAEFTNPERPLLVHQGGMFYRWDGTCWPHVDDADLRAARP